MRTAPVVHIIQVVILAIEAMIDSEAVLREVRQALHGEPRVDFDHQAIRLAFANGELLVSGEVDGIAAKRRTISLSRWRDTLDNDCDR